jgi:hypothetical protein
MRIIEKEHECTKSIHSRRTKMEGTGALAIFPGPSETWGDSRIAGVPVGTWSLTVGSRSSSIFLLSLMGDMNLGVNFRR